MKTQEVIKYAGADQIAREYALSPLGVKVANVLGQVGRASATTIRISQARISLLGTTIAKSPLS